MSSAQAFVLAFGLWMLLGAVSSMSRIERAILVAVAVLAVRMIAGP